MKTKALITVMLLYSLTAISQVNWHSKELFVGINKSEPACLIEVMTNGNNKNNFVFRRPKAFKNARFISLEVQDARTGETVYDIWENSSIRKEIKLDPGRYKVYLTGKIWRGAYGVSRNYGQVKINISWYGKRD